MLNRLIHILQEPSRIVRAVQRRLPKVIHVGPRAIAKQERNKGTKEFRKTFRDSPEGLKAFEREVLARKLFAGKNWIAPILRLEERTIYTPLYPKECRLDYSTLTMNEIDRFAVAYEAVKILFEIFFTGYAHRDFHAKNLFWVDGKLKLVDYECIGRYPEGKRPPFPESYDITGEGLDSPFKTDHMCYTCTKWPEMSLNRILGIPIEKVLDRFSEDMKSNLRKACRTFSSRKGRHMCSSELIYSSFDILHFSVSPEEAQRNSVMRLNDFGITSNSLRGKRVLDLGSNIGSMLFAIQKYKPAYCLGIEYDADKVLVAEQIAAYSGLNNIKFVQADIDTIDIPQVVGPFDIVLCLSVEAHLKKPRRLFRYLSQATTEILYYEGNSTTDVRKTRKALLDSGFHKVTFVGKSRDDIVPNNNCRPLLVALK